MTTNRTNYVAKSPYCDHQLDPSTAVDGRVICDCGKSSDARWVRELGWLQARTDFVTDRINAGDAWYDTTASQSAAPKVRNSLAGEQLLYILGGLSLLTAVGVFAAVSWESLGALGQAGILLAVTAVSAFAAVFLRERVKGLSNTLAVLSSTFLGVLLFAATSFGLFPEQWSHADHWYPLTVFAGIAVASFLAGRFAHVIGWLFVVPLGVVISAILFTQVFLPNYLDLAHINYLNPVVYALFIMLLNRFGYALQLAEFENRGLIFVKLAGQAFLTFAAFTSSVEVGFGVRNELDQMPWLFGLALIFAGAALAHMAFRWVSSGQNLEMMAAKYLSAFVVGAGLSFLFIAPIRTSLMYAEGISVVVGGLIGLSLFIWPVFNQISKEFARFLTTVVVGLWATHAVFAVSGLNGMGQDSRVFGAVFFILLTTGGLVRWWKFNETISFVFAAVSGFVAILQIMIEYGFANENPEPTTLVTAIWLASILHILRRRSFNEMNSGIWLGVPLGTFLIPSAAIAVDSVDYYGADTFDWIRLWFVIVAGIGFTLVGTSKRITGLLIPGAVAYVFALFPQLFVDLGLIVPRWVLFGVFGAILLSVAARYERLQTLRNESGSWQKVFR